MDIQDRVEQLVTKWGSLRAAGVATGISYSYLSRLASGEKVNPSKPVLEKLGLERVITYQRVR